MAYANRMKDRAPCDDTTHVAVLLEEIRGQNEAVLEIVGDMQEQVAEIPKIQRDIQEIKGDIKVMKAVLTDHSGQLHDHEHRIGALEAVS